MSPRPPINAAVGRIKAVGGGIKSVRNRWRRMPDRVYPGCGSEARFPSLRRTLI